MELVYTVPKYDYYAFSDQDDVWHSDKLISAINLIKESRKDNLPTLYYSNLEMCDEKLNSIGLVHSKTDHIILNKFQTVFSSYVHGTTCLFNHELMKIIRSVSNESSINCYAHDTEVQFIASFFGEIVYDNDSHLLYRQHALNVTHSEKYSVKNIVIKIFQSILGLMKNRDHTRLKVLEYYFTKYKNYISRSDAIVIKKILHYRENIIYKIQLLFNHKLLKGPTFYISIYNFLQILFNKL